MTDDSAQRATDITGWKLVPDQPTAAMWEAGRSADIHPGDSYTKVWCAMFEAAPCVDDCETKQHIVAADAQSATDSEADKLAEEMLNYPAVNPRTAVIAVDNAEQGYCIVPAEAMRRYAAAVRNYPVVSNKVAELEATIDRADTHTAWLMEKIKGLEACRKAADYAAKVNYDGWQQEIARNSSSAPASVNEDYPDCTTAREKELYDTLMLLSSAVASRQPEWRNWMQGGVNVAAIVNPALRSGMRSPAQDSR